MVLGLAASVLAGFALSHPIQQAIGPAPFRATDVAFPSASGTTVHGWWVAAPAHRAVILLLAGVRANRTSMVDRARFLTEAGYDVLLIDLQGTGETRGEAITFGWRERLDALAAVAFIHQQAPGEKVGIIGMSLGGAAALLATPPLHVDAMVLEAVYPSIDRAVANRLAIRLGAAGKALAPLLLWQLKPRLGVGPEALRPVDHISRVTAPVFVIAGMADQHTTMADTQLLYDAAHAPKQVWVVPGAAHVDILRKRPAEYRERVLAFFDSALHHDAHADAAAADSERQQD